MKYPTIPLAQTIVAFCKLKQIQHIVISPGSRNFPLILGFTQDPYFKTYSIVDERAAGFFALGIAKEQQYPVALVCTSGSAVVNYAPAVCEAFYSSVPLVVLSADRLPHKINIGDGQTINQQHIFGSHCELSTQLSFDLSHATEELKQIKRVSISPFDITDEKVQTIQKKIQLENENDIDSILNQCISKKTPAHLNIPLEEPLYEQQKETLTLTHTSSIKPLPENENELNCLKNWSRFSKIMVLIGELPNGTSLTDSVLQFLRNQPSISVLIENTSNIYSYGIIDSIDTLLVPIENNEEELRKVQPELVISLGGMLVSKRIKKILRKYSPKEHWHVGINPANDTYFSLNRTLKVFPEVFFKKMIEEQTEIKENNYNKYLFSKYSKHLIQGKKFLKNAPFSDIKIFEALSQKVPKGWKVQIANSSSIRYSQLFSYKNKNKVYCNRGTSGIEGNTSTAMGLAEASKNEVLLVTGDLSFFYDLNGLWNASMKPSFRILLINNQGGGIFRIISKQHKDTATSDNYLETIHKRKAKIICKEFDIDYEKANSMKSFRKKMKHFFLDSESPKLLEVNTLRKINDKVILSYFDSL